MVDLHKGSVVQFSVDTRGKLWVNVDGKCVLRIGKVDTVVFEDMKHEEGKVMYGTPVSTPDRQD